MSTDLLKGVSVCALIALFACDMLAKKDDERKASDDDDKDDKPAASAPEPRPTAQTDQPPQEPTPTAVAGRSPVPKLEEWNQVGEVTVRGSSALNCETKMLREWFRCSCRGKNDTGGTPTNVTVLRGGDDREQFVFASGGVTSLVMPFVEGTHVEASFSWTDKSHKLVVDWPRGAPKPEAVGAFEGASSASAPAKGPSCPKGMNPGPGNTCLLQCSATKPCPAGLACTKDGSGVSSCLPSGQKF